MHSVSGQTWQGPPACVTPADTFSAVDGTKPGNWPLKIEPLTCFRNPTPYRQCCPHRQQYRSAGGNKVERRLIFFFFGCRCHHRPFTAFPQSRSAGNAAACKAFARFGRSSSVPPMAIRAQKVRFLSGVRYRLFCPLLCFLLLADTLFR